MKLGVYVGSFDPVHKGHIYVVNYLLENKYVDKVLIIPTLSYWDKNVSTSLEDRISMLKFYENDNIIIDNKLNYLRYTYEILNNLKYDNHLIIGSDNIKEFHKWKNVDEILKNKVIVLNRDNNEIEKYINEFKQKDSFIVIDDFKNISISSSKLRDYIKDNDTQMLEKYIDIDVLNYIKTKKLYK